MDKKKIIGIVAGAGFVAALSLPAMAEVDVFADIYKDKDKIVYEDAFIDKDYTIEVKQKVDVPNSAEAEVIKNDDNFNNHIYEKDDPTAATINGDSFDGATGVIGVNQSPGNLNNQGNAASVSGTTEGNSFVHAEASVEKINGVSLRPSDSAETIDSLGGGNYLESNAVVKTDLIDGAFDGAAGIIGVNQSAGHMNNQDNAASVSISVDAVAALSESDLGLTNANNYATLDEIENTDTITGSFTTVSGIVGVNQSSGSMNNQANVVAVAFTGFPAP